MENTNGRVINIYVACEEYQFQTLSSAIYRNVS